MYKSTQLLDLVNQALAALPYDRQPAGLYDPIRYALSLGGKRIRPVLMLMAYNLYRENPEHIMMQALGLETYHNFTLLHDDLMDRADVRRGQPTVHRKWNDNQAILSGDTMLLQAYQRVAQCNPRLLPQVLELFTTTTLEIDEGQQLDIEFETRDDVTEEEYIEMIRLKTSVLLACALKMGAVLAEAPADDAALLYDFGEQIGLAFQLQDDYLDVYGDFKVFGKRIGGDILCNKKTYMLINAQLLANEAQRSELERWLAAVEYDEDEKIQAVTRLYDEIGIPQLARQKIEYYYTLAAQSLAKVNLPEERKRILWQYAQQMLNRQN
ncbi:MAG: polyprenyl synthetase family protein [Bacteroidaceae bacterium]|nr:polyprenyl synthetase family protein [Bacteroidaceae bacterium]